MDTRRVGQRQARDQGHARRQLVGAGVGIEADVDRFAVARVRDSASFSAACENTSWKPITSAPSMSIWCAVQAIFASYSSGVLGSRLS
jgi:hypothetical protein